MNWLLDSIVPAWNTEAWKVISGGATIDGSGISLPVNSIVRLSLTTGPVIVASSAMKLITEFRGLFEDDSEYVPKVFIDISITYLDGTMQQSRLMLNKDMFNANTYTDVTKYNVDNKNISKMDIYLINSNISNSAIFIKSINIYKSEDINTGQVISAVSKSVELSSWEDYTDGMIIKFEGGKEDLHLKFIDGTDDEVIGILIDDIKFVPRTRIIGSKPDKGETS